MGNLNFSLGRVQYDSQGQSTFPLEAQVGVGVGASIVALIVLIIVLIYRYTHTAHYSYHRYIFSIVAANVCLYLSAVCATLLFVRRKSKQAMRDYKKVQIQLENLETSVRDRCKKEFTGMIQTFCY